VDAFQDADKQLLLLFRNAFKSLGASEIGEMPYRVEALHIEASRVLEEKAESFAAGSNSIWCPSYTERYYIMIYYIA
jgi:hypothetical protein